MKAEDFFNAYLVLKENNEVLIEKLANSSGKTPEGTKILGTRPAMGVDIVCLAFSVWGKHRHPIIRKMKTA